jgi:hypothetical protein
MNPDDIKRAIHTEPFQSVILRLSNGSQFEVRHSENILIGPRTTAILVGESFQIIANAYVNRIEPLAAAD